MSINNLNNRTTAFVGDGVTVAFPVTFPFHATTDLVVLENVIATGAPTIKTITTHYTVTGTPDALGHYPNGGTVTAVAAPANTVTWTIYRDVPLTQPVDLVENDNLPVESAVESPLDRLTMIEQRSREIATRSLKQPDGDSVAIGTLPAKVARASQYLGFDNLGDPVALAAPANTTAVSAFMATVLDDANAAAARTTLSAAEKVITTKGDLYVGGAAGAESRKAVGTDGYRLLPSSGAADGLAWVGPGFEIVNGYLSVTVAANALTVALKGADGNDPSDSNPVYVVFRNATAGTGTPSIIKVVAASSVVVSSGSTLGTSSGVAHRVYVTAHNDAGTFRLGVYNPLSGSSLLGLMDNELYSSTAEGGAGAADSAQVIYTGTAVATKALRVLGYFESTQATAGTWATTPSKVQPMGFGVRRTGDVVQVRTSSTTATASGTTALPQDDTIPQNTEGTQFFSQTIAPTSAINRLYHEVTAGWDTDASDRVSMALFQDATAGALAALAVMTSQAINQAFHSRFQYEMAAGTVSSTTFNIRAGCSGGSALRINAVNGGRVFGGVSFSVYRITEIFV